MKNDLLPQVECNQNQLCNDLLVENKQSGQEIFLEQEKDSIALSGLPSMSFNHEEGNTKSFNTNYLSETNYLPKNVRYEKTAS